MREVDLVRVKGQTEPVAVYEALDCYDEETFPNLEEVKTTYREGLNLYRRRQWQNAREAFEKVLQLKPQDRPASIHIERCDEFAKNPPAEDWDGVWQMLQK